MKQMKARRYRSSAIQELLDEITPAEREQVKLKMQIAARIEDVMKAKGLTKSDFAQKAGKHPSEITKWLSGTHNFTTDTLVEIALALGVNVSTLFISKEPQIICHYNIVVEATGTVETPIKVRTPYIPKKRFEGMSTKKIFSPSFGEHSIFQ